METHYERYKELEAKHKISYGLRKDEDESDFDVIVQRTESGYGHTSYEVIKNTPNLSMDDLAIIADKGNLCFGYHQMGNGDIHVFTD